MWIGLERRRLPHVGHGENRQIVLGKWNSLRLTLHDVDSERREQPENAPGLGRARRVVIARHHDDGRARQRLHQARELVKRVENGGIAWADGVKNVPGDEHKLRLELDHPVYDAPQRSRDIRLTLVDPGGCLPLVLSEAEVYVREVNQSHRVRVALIH